MRTKGLSAVGWWWKTGSKGWNGGENGHGQVLFSWSSWLFWNMHQKMKLERMWEKPGFLPRPSGLCGSFDSKMMSELCCWMLLFGPAGFGSLGSLDWFLAKVPKWGFWSEWSSMVGLLVMAATSSQMMKWWWNKQGQAQVLWCSWLVLENAPNAVFF